jgi:tRNA-5-methyluridine54 2-sulfurtransferase
MRHHKLALCKDHFLDWIPEQTERFIQKYRMFSLQEKVLVAVSGGKDSLSLWDILVRLGYQAEGLYIGLGIEGENGYSKVSQNLCEEFALERGLHLRVIDVSKEYGASIPEKAKQSRRGIEKPCSICGLTKRHIMNMAARDGGYQVLVTGHNLDDETATLLGNTLNWNSSHLVRQAPVLEERPGMVRKAKPLCRIYERDMAAYALLRGIQYIYEECPFSKGSNSIFYKEMLNQLETKRPGAKINFYTEFLQTKTEGLFTLQADARLDDLHDCPGCGQPTSTPGMCTFCRMYNNPRSG